MLFVDEESKELYAYGGTKVALDPEDPGYNVMTVSRFLIGSSERKAKGQIDGKLRFRCEEGFGSNKDESGAVRLPKYVLMPFKASESSKQSKLFRTQLFYLDWTTNETVLQFLQCLADESLESQESISLWPQWSTLPSEDMIVSYPLIAYKTFNPMDCQIVVANLATNEPQKVIDISPMRFVAFIHTGLQ